MISERDSTLWSVQDLLRHRLIPLIEKGCPERLRMAAAATPAAPLPATVKVPTHEHFYPELCICISGRAEIWTSAGVLAIREGDALMIAPHEVHCAASVHAFTASGVTACSRLLWLSPFPYGCAFNICETSAGTHRSTARQFMFERHASAAIEAMLLELKGSEPDWQQMAKWNLLEALTWLCRATACRAVGPKGAVDGPDCPNGISAATSVAQRAKRFIEANFDRNLDLDTVAQSVGTNKSHLCRAFRTAFGTTVVRYLSHARIEASKRLLLAGLPVSMVSELVGFQDPYYFSRVFHKQVGTPPTAFRAEHSTDEVSVVLDH